MKSWVLLALLSAGMAFGEAQRIVLVQELVRMRAMERRTVVVFPLEQQGGQIEVKFRSEKGGEGVRAGVYQTGSPTPVAATDYEASGTLRTPLARGNEYRVELENLRQRLGEALVDVEISLVFGAPRVTTEAAKTLTPARKRYTILASVSLFAVILAYSAIRLTPPIVRRWRGEV